MTSDERRREAAESLRASANVGGARTLKRELAMALGIRLDDCTPEGSHSKILRGLADLIDRPTCRLFEDEHGYTYCSECGFTAPCMLDASYCPECGARVVRDGD